VSEDKATKERLDYLTKREVKLTREVAALKTRQDTTERRLEKAISALKRGLPHMNLGNEID